MPENPLAQFLPAGEPVERYELYTTQKPIHTTIAELGIDPSSEETVFVARFTESNFWTSLLIDFLPILFLIGLLVFMMRGMGKGAGALPFNVKIGKISDTKKVNTKFKDVAGMDEVKEELMEVVDYLKNPKKYHSVRARTPKGVLLYGEPGTGKTLLARAVAGESNVPFLYSSGAEFMGMFVGVGGEKVRSLFEKAKKMGKAIIFIDEIDAFGKKRGSGVGGHHQ
jgi:cell division protease FtsH